MAVIHPEYHPVWAIGVGLAYLLRLKAEAATLLLDHPAWEEKEQLLV
jgi:hypothetical protein